MSRCSTSSSSTRVVNGATGSNRSDLFDGAPARATGPRPAGATGRGAPRTGGSPCASWLWVVSMPPFITSSTRCTHSSSLTAGRPRSRLRSARTPGRRAGRSRRCSTSARTYSSNSTAACSSSSRRVITAIASNWLCSRLESACRRVPVLERRAHHRRDHMRRIRRSRTRSRTRSGRLPRAARTARPGARASQAGSGRPPWA